MIPTFKISVSLQRYTDKNSIRWNAVNYRQRELTLDEFTELIKQGFCFCHCFRSEGKVMHQYEKRDSNFISAQIVFLDIDDIDTPMEEFVSTLHKKPTLAYTTPNNHTEKSHWLYRFRLCYLFDEPIMSASDYSLIYDSILKSISTDIHTLRMKDNCGRKASQQFSGNGLGNVEIFKSDFIFSFSDFPFENNNASPSFLYKSETEKTKNKHDDIVITDEDFIRDLNCMKPTALIEKYRLRYQYFDRTPLHFENGFALIPDGYMEIHRTWYSDTFEKTNGDIINLTVIKKYRDGEGRRKKLFIAGLIMKKIMPAIKFEHLLYNLVYERTFHYDNSDGVITNNVLYNIARNIINIPVEEISLQSRHKKKFVIDKAYCAEHGITPNTMKNIVRKKLKDEEIGNLYDVSKSVKENHADLQVMGIKVSKTKLYEWCNENGIDTRGERQHDNILDLLSGFSKDNLSLIIEEQDPYHRYFIADDSKRKEILQRQYLELLKAIESVA